MKLHIYQDPAELGRETARLAAAVLKRTVAERGRARLVLSTGASQFDTLEALVSTDVPWEKVEMFHLDEYVGLPESHPASFRRYLKERFTGRVKLKRSVFVDGEGEVAAKIAALSDAIREEPVDLALVGIGENAHIAFNDPPADFETTAAYIVVNLDPGCKLQQVREGWFPDPEAVPVQAITMTVYQIMQSRTIIAPVPYAVKAEAVRRTLAGGVTPVIPATMLKRHPDVTLTLDADSAALLGDDLLRQYGAAR